MDGRPVKLVLDVLLMLLGALLGMAANCATSRTDHVPWPLRLLREWSVPLVAVVLLLLVAGQVWLGCSVIVDQLTDAPKNALGTVRGLLTAQELPSCEP